MDKDLHSIDDKDLDKKKKEAEIKKLEAEVVNLKQSNFKKPVNWIPLLVGIGTFLTGLGQYNSADGRIKLETAGAKEESVKAREEALKAKRELFDTEEKFSKKNDELKQLEIKINDNQKVYDQQKKLIEAYDNTIKEKLASLNQTNQPEKAKEIAKTVEQLITPSILIFYRGTRKDNAQLINNQFLSKGYKSSIIPTNLSEAMEKKDPGTIWVLYTEKGQQKLEDIKSVLDSLGLKEKLDIKDIPVGLLRGDVQILLF